jgi:hypothetical protein
LYHATNPMWRVDKNSNRVNIEDFYNPQIGRPVQADAGSAEAIVLPYVGQHVFGMLEYSTADAENLTGWTRYSQGTDAQSLNKTLGGMRMITNMSQQRIKMMARNFGEMCFSRCLRGVSKLLSQHGSKALAMRISGQYVEVDPREWAEEYDMTVNVGLGTLDREQQAMQLGQVAQAQAAAVQGGGMGKLITPKNLYNVQQRIADLSGIKDPTFAWTDPDSVPAPQGPPPPPPEVQKEEMRIQADQQKFQAQAQIDQQSAQMEAAGTAAQNQHDAQLALQLEQMKQEHETARTLQVEQMRLQHQAMVAATSDRIASERTQTQEAQGGIAQAVPAIQEALSMLANGLQTIQQLVASVEGSKTVAVEKVRDAQGKMVAAVVTKADGTRQQVTIQ